MKVLAFTVIIIFGPYPSSNQGGDCNPLSVFPGRSKNAKESDLRLLSNLFYILCGHFDENKLGVPPYLGVG